jgi:tetratricopeptide (TPR) repeat protein
MISQAESKKSLSFIDINTISPIYCNPKKAWKELLESIENIYKNFKKSEIDPEEIKVILNIDEKNKNNVPDVISVDYVIAIINRYIHDYKISNATAPFLEFKRHSAIYLFSIGSQEKALELLKEILTVVSDVTNLTNPDINLTCIRDCVRLNQASIHFWLGDFEESRQLLEKVITYYESTSEELYLIKMANFISVGFTYLAWIYTKINEFEDAERAFLHSLKVMKLVKQYTKTSLKEENFINTRVRKIFIYDQLINFYTFTKQVENCDEPLMEILKIMDKSTFEYDLDVKPENHVYYYVTAIYYTLKKPKVDLSKALHYMFNIINIIYKNSESFDMIPKCFFERIFNIIELIHLNNNNGKLKRNRKNNNDDELIKKEEALLNKLSEYFDEIIAIYDEDKVLSLNVEGGTIVDNMITLEKFSYYIQNPSFCEFNFIRDIKNKTEENLANAFPDDFEINEIYIVKLITERMLYKYATIITDLVDCKTITDNICLEGLNGFLLVENDELVLYSIYRFQVRDGTHTIHPGKFIN